MYIMLCQADLVFSVSPSVGILYTQQLPAGNGATARMEIKMEWMEIKSCGVWQFKLDKIVTAAKWILFALTFTQIYVLS